MIANIFIDRWVAFTADNQQTITVDHGKLLDEAAATNVSFLPPLSRRRLSALSKLCLRLAQECAPDYQGYCVFGSQHGELLTTQKLLDSIVRNELLSPAGFSSSVHNTAVGLHSLHNHNESPCTSIAAGVDTLSMCFLEAYSLINNAVTDEVLVVYADDVIPDGLAGYTEEPNIMRGFAALVTAEGNGLRVSIRSSEQQHINRDQHQIRRLVAVLTDKLQRSSFELAGECFDWDWEIDGK